jgi:hypothetical protein
MQALLVTKGSGPVHECGEYSLFIGRMVVRVGAEVEVNVHGLVVNLTKDDLGFKTPQTSTCMAYHLMM